MKSGFFSMVPIRILIGMLQKKGHGGTLTPADFVSGGSIVAHSKGKLMKPPVGKGPFAYR